jgi:hypothetical protein
MVVLAVRVGLPQFNHGIRDRQSIAIEHAADHCHALSLDIFAGNARERSLVSEAKMKVWPNSLRGRRDQICFIRH